VTTPTRMPRYDVRNDGAGPYAAFYCERCDREYRSQPDVGTTIAKDVGRQAMGGFLRRIPLVGDAVADNVVGEDPRYTYHLTPAQLKGAWEQTIQYFRECPACGRIVCLSCFDQQTGFCNDDSPRREEIAEAGAEQAVGVIKGIASAFGLDQVAKQAAEAAKGASRCSQCGAIVPAGAKFCPECGAAMTQPAPDVCPNCGAELNGAKFCPQCGTKIERAAG
jgi:hypothetical protein